MKRLSSTDTPAEEITAEASDTVREAMLEELSGELGDALVGSHLEPGIDLTIRVTAAAWADTAAFLRNGMGFAYFNFVSAIDWMPSPFGRDMDSQVDLTLDGTDPKDPAPMEQGTTGGDTRFQVFARVNDIVNHRGITIKADVPEDSLTVPTWVGTYSGANWHEREAWEMFGISFEGHPGLRHIYLPGEFEGNPLRKDYPLLARRVKPWPGIVDVEAMPGDDEEAEGEASDD
ncbi:MAG: NADH-quinone oxidoreductase subunit C [Candidatus Aldehydirespiratoraceae bacterium]